MTRAVFGDASFLVALINARDQHHQRALQLNASLAAPMVTTAWVLLEFAKGLPRAKAGASLCTLAKLLLSTDAR